MSAVANKFSDKQNSQLLLISLETNKTESAVSDKFGDKQNKVSCC